MIILDLHQPAKHHVRLDPGWLVDLVRALGGKLFVTGINHSNVLAPVVGKIFTSISASSWDSDAILDEPQFGIATDNIMYGFMNVTNLPCNPYGQLGRGTTGGTQGQCETQTAIEPFTGAGSVVEVSSGYTSSCAIRAVDHQLWCWGTGTSGQIGNGGFTDQHLAVPVLGTF